MESKLSSNEEWALPSRAFQDGSVRVSFEQPSGIIPP